LILCADQTLHLHVRLKMDQRMLIAYLGLKELSARAIREDPTATFGRDAVVYSSVARCLGEARLLPSSEDAPSANVHRGVNDSDQALLSTFNENRFASLRQLFRLAHMSPTTVYRRLTEVLGFTTRHLRRVPHALSDAQKARRVDLSLRLLRMPEIQRDRAWHGIVTGDESWFYLTTDHELIGLPRDGAVPERERSTVQ
jgi:AraC-like DNA-binding protein